MRSLFFLSLSNSSCLPWTLPFLIFLSHFHPLSSPPPPPPSHPSASLLLNLEIPPFSRSPSSHSPSFSPATCHRSLSCSSLQTIDPLPSFFFFFLTLFLASCFTRRLSFSRATFAGPLLRRFLFYQKKCNLHMKPQSQKWASCCFAACPSAEVLYNYLACDVSTSLCF